MDSKYCVLFDEKGERWTPEELGHHLRTRLRGATLISFVIRNLGFVLAESGFGSHIRVSYVSDAVVPVALTGLVMWLYDQPDRPVVIHESSGRITGALYPTRAKATEAISDTISALAQSTPYSCVLSDVESSIFSSRWRAAVELVSIPSLDSESARKVLNALFDGYFTIAERRTANDEFRLLCVGDAVRTQFGDRVKGRSYREMYDAEYGSWVADGIRTSTVRQRPIAQEIVAPIKWPDNKKPILCRYSRLIVSASAPAGELLVTASHIHSKNLH